MSGSSGHSVYGGHRCAPYTVQLTGHGDLNVTVMINAIPGPMIGGGVSVVQPLGPAPMTPSGFRKGDGKRGGKDAGKSGGSDGFEVIESGTPGIPATPGPFAKKGGESGGKDGGKDGGRSSSESGKGGCKYYGYEPPVGFTRVESVELPDESRPM